MSNGKHRGTVSAKYREGDPQRCWCGAWDLPYEHIKADHEPRHIENAQLRAERAGGER